MEKEKTTYKLPDGWKADILGIYRICEHGTISSISALFHNDLTPTSLSKWYKMVLCHILLCNKKKVVPEKRDD